MELYYLINWNCKYFQLLRIWKDITLVNRTKIIGLRIIFMAKLFQSLTFLIRAPYFDIRFGFVCKLYFGIPNGKSYRKITEDLCRFKIENSSYLIHL